MIRCTAPKHVEALRLRGARQLMPPVTRITVGCATCGCARGAREVFAAFRRQLRRRGIPAQLDAVGCSGWCSREPLVTVQQPGMPKLTFGEVTPRDVPDLLEALAGGTVPAATILYRTDAEENIVEGTVRPYARSARAAALLRGVPSSSTLPLLKRQKRIVMRNCGIIDPLNLEQYCGRGGFIAACTALTRMRPEQVVAEIARSGLRGRGGAGFPTGRKWQTAAQAPGRTKYVVCNADEGDPGAYMDRSILEGDPFSVLEGMLIAGYAIGASEGIVYVRREYPLAVETIAAAVRRLKRCGLLGRRILGTAFDFTVHVAQGAGAFVCGEETALIASLEGRTGEPVPRPPYPVAQGLYGKPTCINNVETLATVPVIISRGSRWFAKTGVSGNTGTKIFSLVGAAENVGLIEVPLGTSLKDIVYGIGGGIAGGRTLKAVQTGGPSGGCIPARRIDVPVTYEALARAGSIMGSGGMIVLDQTACMVDLARYFMGFLREESCGKCLPCREGTDAAFRLLDAITRGKGTMRDIDTLEKICEALSATSLCGLGRTAANPVLSTLRAFRAEYEAHIRARRCPAGVCAALVRVAITPGVCIGCGACMKACPAGAVTGAPKKPHRINRRRCVGCRACADACPAGAVVIS